MPNSAASPEATYAEARARWAQARRVLKRAEVLCRAGHADFDLDSATIRVGGFRDAAIAARLGCFVPPVSA